MQKFLRVTVLTVSALCIACTSPATPEGHEAANPTRPLLVLTGADSRVNEPACHRVTSEEAWQTLWLSHLGKTEDDRYREHLPIAQVDFEECMVIAIFKGAATNSRGLNVISVHENKDSVSLRFDDMSYQTSGGLDGGGGAVPVTPYAFVLIPKSAKSVLVEENVQGLKDTPPKWKARARLKAD